jgi:hypothetical protein
MPDMVDSRRRLNWIQLLQKLQIIYELGYVRYKWIDINLFYSSGELYLVNLFHYNAK